jgi:diguanylate cyclase (GGDEF)-like protein
MVDALRGGRNGAALAILALSALLLTPFLFQRAIAKNRLVYTGSLDPARSAASEAMLALAREISAIRGYLLTDDRSLLQDYQQARRAQDAALAQLQAVSHVDPAMQRQAESFMAAARAWNASNDSLAAGAIDKAAATRRLREQQAKYMAALDAGQSLDHMIVRSVSRVRDRVGGLEHRWALATLALAVVATAGAIVVVTMMRTSVHQSALARTDPLTGLYNRLGFDELAVRELHRGRRNASATTLVSFDLDGFKRINDEHGHAAGDEVLRSVGRALRAAVRNIDVAARLGGDEFAVLLPDNRAQPPERAVERVIEAISEALSRDRAPVTVSVGAVTVQAHEITVDEMIRVADKLMYSVKNDGKNAMRHEMLSAVPGAGV